MIKRSIAIFSFVFVLALAGYAQTPAATTLAVPEVGSAAPTFKLTSNEGKQVSLKDYKGKYVVLYFYPKNFTSGCTLEAKNFAAGFAAPQGITQRAQRGTRILSTAPEKISFEFIKANKLSTRVETADDFVDEIVSTARAHGTARCLRRPAAVPRHHYDGGRGVVLCRARAGRRQESTLSLV